MARRHTNSIFVTLLALIIAACGETGDSAQPDTTDTISRSDAAAGALQGLSPDGPQVGAPRVGVMSSLPLYWPIGADFAQLAQGESERPWARRVIEQRFRIEPLDTLSPIEPLAQGEPEIDPIKDLARLAVVQPRGLSPADNVALDEWVRAGGVLLLVLDPALTGEYPFALGDPRHPPATALIPPIVKRWGLSVSFDESQSADPRLVTLDDGTLPLLLTGGWSITDPKAADCSLHAEKAVATCAVGRGRVTLVADAALFEHPELAGEKGERMLALFGQALR